MKFINIGFGNMVSAQRIVAIASPDSAPIKRLVQDAKEDGRVIDASCGRRTRSVIVTDSEHIILSAIQTETITNRLTSDEEIDAEDPIATFLAASANSLPVLIIVLRLLSTLHCKI